MRIETYDEHGLVEVREVDYEPLPPNYAEFSTSILLSPAYLALMEAIKGQEIRSTLELLLVRLELKKIATEQDLNLLKVVWDKIIDSGGLAAFKPGDREELNSKAESTRMPFRFDENYKLTIYTHERET